MRILLLGFGSRGDVQPLLALGHGLEAAGYEVAIGAGSNFRSLIENEGFIYEAIRTDMEQVVNSESGKEWINNSSDNPFREAQNMKRVLAETADETGEDAMGMISRADVVVSGLPTFTFAHGICKKLGKKHITINLFPFSPTAEGDATMIPYVPRRNFPLNRLSGYVQQYFLYWIFKDASNAFFAKQGIPAMNYGDYTRAYNKEVPIIYGVSPLVMPHPNDWKDSNFVTGYWFYDAPSDWNPSQALSDFLKAGEAPVYIGFGSMSNKNPEATAKLMIEALQASGKRGIIHTGWAGLRAENLPKEIFLLDFAPHDWLFPQMAAVVHHGGSGTTAAALRAGVPSVIVPHFGDQPYWGRRIHELGVGAAPIPRHKLNSERLAKAIQSMVNNPSMKEKATKLGAAIRQERGVENAVKAFDKLLR
jgi:sterol 3beta-glucosyltransferase